MIGEELIEESANIFALRCGARSIVLPEVCSEVAQIAPALDARLARHRRIEVFARVKDHLGGRTQYSYDGSNRLASAIDARAVTYLQNTYDALGRVTSVATPESGTVNNYYTKVDGTACAGDPTLVCRVQDARGITKTLNYDGINRLSSVLRDEPLRLRGLPGFEHEEADPPHVPLYLARRLFTVVADWKRAGQVDQAVLWVLDVHLRALGPGHGGQRQQDAKRHRRRKPP